MVYNLNHGVANVNHQRLMRSYAQFCPVARALDVVGERWALLIVRELLIRPCRFTDLRDGLPGIASNLLADRLRHLEEAGVVERAELPPPAASTVYRVTERGRALGPVVVELAVWGAPLLASGRGEDAFFGRWMALLEVAVFQGVATEGVAPMAFDLVVDGETARLNVAEDGVTVVGSPVGPADVIVTADAVTAAGVLMREVELQDAVGRGEMRLDGQPEAVTRLATLLGRIEGFRSTATPRPG